MLSFLFFFFFLRVSVEQSAFLPGRLADLTQGELSSPAQRTGAGAAAAEVGNSRVPRWAAPVSSGSGPATDAHAVGHPRPSPAERRGDAPWELSTPPLAGRRTSRGSWGWTPRSMNCNPPARAQGERKELLRGVEDARSLKAFAALSLSPSRSCLTRRKGREIHLLRGGFSHRQSGARQGHVGRFTGRLGEGAVAAVVGDEDCHSR